MMGLRIPRIGRRGRLILGLVLGAALILLSGLWQMGWSNPPELRWVAYASCALAFAVLAARGLSDLTPAFWVVLLTAYPVLAPLIGIDLGGFPLFASGPIGHQTLQTMAVPCTIGAIAALIFAICLPAGTVLAPFSQHWPAVQGRDIAPGTALTIFACACLGTWAMNWIEAPPDLLQLGQVSYRALKEGRNDSLNFVSGMITVFATLSLASLLLVVRNAGIRPRLKIACGAVFALLCASVVVWQLMAASRIEAVGLLLALHLTFGNRLHPALRWIAIGACITVLAAVGYLRTLAGLLAYLQRDFLSWPGGVENVYNTYLVGLVAVRDGDIPAQLGQTYLNLVLRLPPNFLGLDRPPRAYDLITAQQSLIGGEYFLSEPYLNFHGPGIVIAIGGIVLGFRAVLAALQRFYDRPEALYPALLALVVLTLSFRLFWYGLDHSVKTLVMAALFYGPIGLLMARFHASSLRDPQRGADPRLAGGVGRHV